MKEIELIGKRKAREKHFLKQNGVIEAQVFDEDIHFLKNGIYEEIDNTLIDKGDCYTNKNNAYEVKLYKDTSDNLMEVSIDDKFIKTRLLNPNLSELTENIMESKLHKNVCYSNILDNIDLEYNVLPTKVKEAIILKNKNVCTEKLVFSIETNMKLSLLENKKIIAEKDGVQIFEFDAPYMIDNEFKVNNNVFYELTECDCDKYSLKIKIDEDWLKDENTKYPVMIDPTITNSGQNNNVYDTYISSGSESNDNFGDQDGMFVGVSPVSNNITRALLKFDLPTIGTGSQIIDASINLVGYAIDGWALDLQLINVHRVTEPWTEKNATWNTMNNKYDPKIESIFYARRSDTDGDGNVTPSICGASITNLVRKWYTGTPNYGVMLKANEEIKLDQAMTMFYTKENDVIGENPKPVLVIFYRNQNGLEEYMDYQKQSFHNGMCYINNYNGNLTTVFDVGSTGKGKMPVNLSIVYNTNDVVLNNDKGYGLGYKLSLHQTIREQKIGDNTYLEYSDEYGTLHYFLNERKVDNSSNSNAVGTGNIFYDEDGLDLTILKNADNYVLSDKNGNMMTFAKNGDCAYLKEIKDVSGNKCEINYNSNKLITKITDANNTEINIGYGDNAIIITSPTKSTTLEYLNNQLVSIIDIMGKIEFEYNEKKILSKITDVTGITKTYEYYNQKPYKVKKVSEYGIENTLGEFFEMKYGFDSTTITDSIGNAKNIVFNSQGSIATISGLKSLDDINNSYGISEINGTLENGATSGTNNKLLKSEIPIKYVNNLLTNTSFEEEKIEFVSSENINAIISNDTSNTGSNCLKVTSTSENQYIYQNVSVKKGSYYTFSAYIKNSNKVRLCLGYKNEDNETIEEFSEVIKSNENFNRYDTTIYYPDNSSDSLYIKFLLEENGITYIDDIQLEIGEVANDYNLIENSNFSSGISGWIISAQNPSTGNDESISDKYEVVSLENGITAVKIKKNPSYSVVMKRHFKISGKGGDKYNISFWYKNEGILSNLSMDYGSRVFIGFEYINQDDGHCELSSPELNINDESWQFVSNDFVAEKDYSSICLTFTHIDDANDVYITNLSLFKNIESVYYEYDENGNVILEKNLDNSIEKFNYDKNNQLIKMTDPQGKAFKFEYDNSITDRVINGISEAGVSNEIIYDNNNNPIITKTIKNNVKEDISDGLYNIRLKGLRKYLKIISDNIAINDNYSSDIWKVEKYDSYYKIQHYIVSNKYLSVNNGLLGLSSDQNDKSLFELKKNDNGSYLIKLKSENKYLKYNNSGLEVSDLIEGDYHFQFYFETNDFDKFIENNSEYTEDGKFIKSVTDSLGNTNFYNINPSTELIASETNAKGNMTEYKYNKKNQLVSVSSGNKKVTYEYNDKNLLSKVIHGRKECNFNYDEFLNISSINIGNKFVLVKNHYNSTGDLISFEYGNGDMMKYEYDEFYRIKKMIKQNKAYDYFYDGSGNLVKIISEEDVIRYKYDMAKKLSEYRFNDFITKYKYDANDNIISIKYNLGNITNEINNLYEDNLCINTTFEEGKINYKYDLLGRVEKSILNSNFETNYKYLGNGKNTSTMIQQLKLGNDRYFYKYDKSNNITHVYKNEMLINKYYYDDYNQLIKEINYLDRKLIKYKYDNVGNILLTKEFDINTYDLLSINKYEYNKDWEDQLLSFNDDTIIYDEIGNPLSIGNDIRMTWTNGRELSTYTDKNCSLSYKYNKDGVRVSKIVNGIETKYYFDEDNDIVFEKCGNNVIYYIRNDFDDLIGFRFNENVYYYVKDIHGDIIQIIDSDCNIIAKYVYNSWGKVISITDGNDNDISNNLNHIANINPYRYRSYYYDSETKLYYLNDRYYNPEWGRFINSDSYAGEIGGNILSHNVYSYGLNNPITNIDYNGKFAIAISPIFVAAGIFIIGALAFGAKAMTKSKHGAGLANAIDKIRSKNPPLTYNPPKIKANDRSESKAKSNIKAGVLAKKGSPTKPSNEKPCMPAYYDKETDSVYVLPTRLTIKKSAERVKKGGDIMCDNRHYAKRVTKSIKKGKIEVKDTPHQYDEGFFPHYHYIKGKMRVHIWWRY